MSGAFARLGRWLRGGRAREGEGLGEVPEPVALTGPWRAGVAVSMHSGEEGLTPAGELLDRFKYGGERRLAPTLGRALAEVVRSRPEFDGVQAVVHVPATRRRRRAEPTCDLARAAARALRARCLPGLIACVRPAAAQKDLFRWAEKVENVRGAFRVRRAEFVKGRRLLLVDDVYDSGATLEEVWRVLMEAGAAEVLVATVTKTHYRREG